MGQHARSRRAVALLSYWATAPWPVFQATRSSLGSLCSLLPFSVVECVEQSGVCRTFCFGKFLNVDDRFVLCSIVILFLVLNVFVLVLFAFDSLLSLFTLLNQAAAVKTMIVLLFHFFISLEFV